MRSVLLTLATGVVAASLVATGGAAERFKRHSVPGPGLSLAVPASWVAVNASLPDAAIERLRRENPRLAPTSVSSQGPTRLRSSSRSTRPSRTGSRRT